MYEWVRKGVFLYVLITCERIVSRKWMDHVTCVSKGNVTQINKDHVPHVTWAMSQIWISLVTRLNESCHTHGRVMSHILMNRVESHIWVSHTYEWVAGRSRSFFSNLSLVANMDTSLHTHVNAACRTCGWVKSHIWMRHGTLVNESRHKYDEWTLMYHTTQVCVCVSVHERSCIILVLCGSMIHERPGTHIFMQMCLEDVCARTSSWRCVCQDVHV